jgi:hypothetical protein
VYSEKLEFSHVGEWISLFFLMLFSPALQPGRVAAGTGISRVERPGIHAAGQVRARQPDPLPRYCSSVWRLTAEQGLQVGYREAV